MTQQVSIALAFKQGESPLRGWVIKLLWVVYLIFRDCLTLWFLRSLWCYFIAQWECFVSFNMHAWGLIIYWEDSGFFINTHLIYVYTHLQLCTVKITVNHLSQGDQAGHHQARCTAEQSPYSNTHTGLWKWSAEEARCLCCPRPTFQNCFAHREITFTRCHQPSGTCSPAHSFGIALPAGGGGAGGWLWWGLMASTAAAGMPSPSLPVPFCLFILPFIYIYIFFFCFPALPPAIFHHVLDKHKLHRKNFKVPSTE